MKKEANNSKPKILRMMRKQRQPNRNPESPGKGETVAHPRNENTSAQRTRKILQTMMRKKAALEESKIFEAHPYTKILFKL